jgi:flagellar motor protein MotB
VSSSGDGLDKSLADLMAGVAVVFLLLAVIFILRLQDQLKQTESRLEKVDRIVEANREERERVATELGFLQKQLREMESTEQDGGVRAGFFRVMERKDPNVVLLEAATEGDGAQIQTRGALFRSNQCDVTEEAEKSGVVESLLRKVSLICRTRERLVGLGRGTKVEINLEGHSDPFNPTERRCNVRLDNPFFDNIRLSSARAEELFFRVVALAGRRGDATIEECLHTSFVVSGRGSVEPKVDPAIGRLPSGGYDSRHQELRAADRRVVIRVRATPVVISDLDGGP